MKRRFTIQWTDFDGTVHVTKCHDEYHFNILRMELDELWLSYIILEDGRP